MSWDGHALTLSLLAALLAEKYAGDVAHLRDLPPPIAGEPRYERVHRVLRRYDDHLSDAERAFLEFFSAFRTPVDVQKPVFLPGTSEAAKNDEEKTGFSYTTHPLIRAHYFARLAAGAREQTQATHERIEDYYIAIAGDTTNYPTM